MTGCALQVCRLRVSFDEKVVLRDLSFDLYCGEILALMGTSGAGKSVVLRTIIGLQKPDEGKILFEGVDLVQLSEADFYPIRKEIGYVFQTGALFDSMTVEENLGYPLRIHTRLTDGQIRERVNERLKSVDLVGTNQLYPDEISGGMVKRLGLLRATMCDPKVVLLDEPTAGLDPIHVGAFVQTVRKIKKTRGITGIFVSHDVPTAFAISDRIAFLEGGVIRSSGTVDEMQRASDPWIRSFIYPEYGAALGKAA